MLLVLFGVSVLTYLMIFFTPGDPAEIILTQDMESPPTQEEIRQFRVEHGLDEPIPIQYANWM